MIARRFVADGRRLTLVAASLMLVPFAIHSVDFAAYLGHARAWDALPLFLLPIALAVSLGVVAERGTAAAVLWVTIGQAALAEWRLYRLDYAVADAFRESPLAIAATILGVAAGVGAFVRLRAQVRAAMPRGAPFLGRAIGSLAGLLLAWSVFHDSSVAVAIRDSPNAGIAIALVWFVVPVGLAFAAALASLAGERRFALVSAVAFSQVWWWGMMLRPTSLSAYPEEDTLGGIVVLFGMSLAAASYVLVRPAKTAADGPARLAAPEPPASARAPRNRLAVAALLLAWVPFAGVVLGHVALRQIGRTGAPGRSSALVGLALAYPWTLVFSSALLIFWSIHEFLRTATTF